MPHTKFVDQETPTRQVSLSQIEGDKTAALEARVAELSSIVGSLSSIVEHGFAMQQANAPVVRSTPVTKRRKKSISNSLPPCFSPQSQPSPLKNYPAAGKALGAWRGAQRAQRVGVAQHTKVNPATPALADVDADARLGWHRHFAAQLFGKKAKPELFENTASLSMMGKLSVEGRGIVHHHLLRSTAQHEGWRIIDVRAAAAASTLAFLHCETSHGGRLEFLERVTWSTEGRVVTLSRELLSRPSAMAMAGEGGLEGMDIEAILEQRPNLVTEIREYIKGRPDEVYDVAEEAEPPSRSQKQRVSDQLWTSPSQAAAPVVALAEQRDGNSGPERHANTPLKSRYGLHETLGAGNFGCVKRAVKRDGGAVVAIKVLEKEWVSKSDVDWEVRMMTCVAEALGDHAVALHEVFEDEFAFSLVMERCGETLTDRVECGQVTESVALEYAAQLLRGLEKLHAAGIVHRDIKPDNILLSDSSPGAHCKIADLGLAAECSSNFQLCDYCGTPAFMSPEAIWCGESYEEDRHGCPVKVVRSYGFATDIWSLGCVIYYMLCGYAAFQMDYRVGWDEWNLADEVWAKYSPNDEWYPATVTKILPTPEGGVELRVHYDGFDDENAEWKDPSLEGDSYEIEKKDAGGDQYREGDGKGWFDYEGMFELIGEAAYPTGRAEWEALSEVPSRQLIASFLVVNPNQRKPPREALRWLDQHQAEIDQLQEEAAKKARKKLKKAKKQAKEANEEDREASRTDKAAREPDAEEDGEAVSSREGSRENDDDDLVNAMQASSLCEPEEEEEENVLYSDESRRSLRPSPRRPAEGSRQDQGGSGGGLSESMGNLAM